MAAGHVVDDEQVVEAGPFNGLHEATDSVGIGADVVGEPGAEPHSDPEDTR